MLPSSKGCVAPDVMRCVPWCLSLGRTFVTLPQTSDKTRQDAGRLSACLVSRAAEGTDNQPEQDLADLAPKPVGRDGETVQHPPLTAVSAASEDDVTER